MTLLACRSQVTVVSLRLFSPEWCKISAAACSPSPRQLTLHRVVITSIKQAQLRASILRLNMPLQGTQGTSKALQPSPEVLRLWNEAEAVAFDVDSTLCEDESIDELAAYLGLGDEVAAMTASAMGGTVTFQDALAARLSLMQPTRQHVADFLADHPPRLSKGIPELVAELHGRGKAVFLVSGGFRAIINPIAEMLGIPLDNVFANTILYKNDGTYAGFDAEEYTSQSGGKAAAILALKAKHDFNTVVMVGDGATDLEARQPGGADLFIGYGGVVERPTVAAGADWYTYSIQSLRDALSA